MKKTNATAAPLSPSATRKIEQAALRKVVAAKKEAKKTAAAKKAAKKAPAKKAAKKAAKPAPAPAAKTVTAPATRTAAKKTATKATANVRAPKPAKVDLSDRLALGRTALAEMMQTRKGEVKPYTRKPEDKPVMGRPPRIDWSKVKLSDWQNFTDTELSRILGCSVPNVFNTRKRMNATEAASSGKTDRYTCKRGKYAKTVALPSKAVVKTAAV